MPDSDINLINPDGDFVTVPASYKDQALAAKFTVPSPEQLQQENEKQVYESGPGMAASGLAGIVHGALPFGIGAKVLKAVGVPAEAQEKMAKYNPTLYGSGALSGAFAPSGVATAAGKAGEAAASVARLGELGPEAGVAAKIASHMVRGAAEGATFGINNVANDAVLGDPNLVAQHALSEIGTSALWGAGISGGLGLTAAALPRGVEGAKTALNGLSDNIGLTKPLDAIKNAGQEGFASISSAVSGVPKETIMARFRQGAEDLAEINPQEFTKGLQDLHNSMESSVKEAVNTYDTLSPELQGKLEDYLGSVNSVKGSGDFAKQFMYKTKEGLKIDPVKVETFLKNTNSTKGIKAASALSEYMQSTSDLADSLEHEYTVSSPVNNVDYEDIRNLVDKNQSVLEQQQTAAMASKAAKMGIGGGGLSESAGLGFVGHALGIPGAVLGGAVAGIEALRNPLEAIDKLAKLQGAISKSAKTIGRMTDSLASSSSGELAGTLKGFTAGKLAASDKKQYDKNVQQIQALNNDVSGTAEKIQRNTALLESHAPAVVGAMTQTAGRALSFLNSKIPPMTAPGPLARKPEPSPAQISSFNKYYQAVNKPLSVLKEAQKGTMTHESIEALNAVHPALYNQMKQSLISSMGNNKNVKDLPYQRKLMLSMFLGQNLDGSMNPMSIQANQAMLAISNAQAQAKQQAFIGTPKPTSKGMREISLNQRTLTPLQATSLRSGAQ